MDHPHHTHPVVACARAVRAALLDVADLDPTFMPTQDKAAALLAIREALAWATALHARLLAAAGDVARDTGARDAAAWLAHEARGDIHAERRSLRLGRSLEAAPIVSAALAGGRIDLDKAKIILRALEDLPGGVTDELRDRAEAALAEHAVDLSPRALARVARHLDALIDPDAADLAEARALLREERSAWERTSLRLVERFDGTATINGVIPVAAAHRLRTYLEAFSQPRRPAVSADAGPGPARRDQLSGRAFCDLLEHIDPSALPLHGGDATTVMVAVSLSELRSELGAASLGGFDAEQRISAGEVRRLACSAQIIPIVLDGDSRALDVGRTKRLHTPAQRKALRAMHATCQVEGCTIPSSWCDVHHVNPWSAGGRTDLENALLVCGHHHRRLHDSRYEAAHSGRHVRLRMRRYEPPAAGVPSRSARVDRRGRNGPVDDDAEVAGSSRRVHGHRFGGSS